MLGVQFAVLQFDHIKGVCDQGPVPLFMVVAPLNGIRVIATNLITVSVNPVKNKEKWALIALQL